MIIASILFGFFVGTMIEDTKQYEFCKNTKAKHHKEVKVYCEDLISNKLP